jgi:hypothetical protein
MATEHFTNEKCTEALGKILEINYPNQSRLQLNGTG